MATLPLLLGLTVLGTVSGDVSTKLKVKYSWNQLDFAFPTAKDRADAIESGRFIQSNNLPLGIDVSVSTKSKLIFKLMVVYSLATTNLVTITTDQSFI